MFSFGFIFMVAFWGFIIYGLIWMFKSGNHSSNHRIPAESESALEILKERYAKGEITKEEFTSIKNDIS
ncbi:SHOCT domain-containing protein [Candidatus Gracilibacteria bacterium]|nr:SHOCT domain-containing protein [Candidatus Gracilibacteria bacterium]MCF7898975.1 SHOCT domain-containing protein [Candidatus Paceibacterota bacterium]